jgi:hypothetical protein
MTALRSKYVLCTPWNAPVELDIHNYKDDVEYVFLTYWIRVLRNVEEISLLSDLTFYIVWHNRLVRELPTYGKNVVAIILMDEERTIPVYCDKVGFIFKTYGFKPWCAVPKGLKFPSYLLKCLREHAIWAAHYNAYLRSNGRLRLPKRMEVVPLGYARQTDAPAKPFEMRKFAVGFLGSLEHNKHHRLSPRALFGTPKTLARKQMISSLQNIRTEMPENVFISTTNSFNASISAGGERYSEIMADTKICLAPRGSSSETYRFF